MPKTIEIKEYKPFVPVFERFIEDKKRYKAMGGIIDSENVILGDFGKEYINDGQYIFMNLWAFKRILESKVKKHYDLGSQIEFVSWLTNFMEVEHVDIRDPGINLKNINIVNADIRKLPYDDNSIDSISCLHVAEHIGLGRYGDSIDPLGFDKGCAEISRVLSKSGMLYFAVPTGEEKVYFNAHRVLSSSHVLEAFRGLSLIEFSGMDSVGRYAEKVPVNSLDKDKYGCGMYLFTKE